MGKLYKPGEDNKPAARPERIGVLSCPRIHAYSVVLKVLPLPPPWRTPRNAAKRRPLRRRPGFSRPGGRRSGVECSRAERKREGDRAGFAAFRSGMFLAVYFVHELR